MSNRCVVPHYAHHICHRGVRKDPMFHDDSDYLVYMRVLKKGCVAKEVLIWAYALMLNHVHLVGVPKDEKSISKRCMKPIRHMRNTSTRNTVLRGMSGRVAPTFQLWMNRTCGMRSAMLNGILCEL